MRIDDDDDLGSLWRGMYTFYYGDIMPQHDDITHMMQLIMMWVFLRMMLGLREFSFDDEALFSWRYMTCGMRDTLGPFIAPFHGKTCLLEDDVTLRGI